jgi:hypothetical protein
MANTHVPISSNDIPSEVTYTPGVGVSAVEGGTQLTDANGNTYAPEVVDITSTGEQTIAIAAGKATNTIVKSSPGRLGRILVTTVGSNAMLIYDSATTNSGTPIGAIPASAPIGPYESGFPAAIGITVAGNASNPAVTISFS